MPTIQRISDRNNATLLRLIISWKSLQSTGTPNPVTKALAVEGKFSASRSYKGSARCGYGYAVRSGRSTDLDDRSGVITSS
ncbi:hypothetical protein CVT25_012045 [Psilocybe cyanescens]|uniref:Uncharacterized protein n=1 Tax=Psilocybe cyanescens TaxID=93625 RepID=A0A409XLC4_PSICY|nr:hypothetical protein CVT25_012045 [Psilocybe cyanescens]